MDTAAACDLEFAYRGRSVKWRLTPPGDYIGDVMRGSGFFFGARCLLDSLRYIPDGASVVDVGAHIGSTAVWWALACRARRVVAIEPDPGSFGLLHDNIALNGLSGTVTPLQVAVGSACGKAERTYSEPGNSGGSQYRPSPSGGIDIVTLDSLVHSGIIDSADVLKIDVEGYECAVLDGAADFFRRFSPVVLAESWRPGGHNAGRYIDAQANRDAFMRKMRAMGYATVLESGDSGVFIRTGVASPSSAAIAAKSSAMQPAPARVPPAEVSAGDSPASARTSDDPLFSLLTPYDIPGLTRVRLGRGGDGGYVAASELLGKIDHIVSSESGGDISFEYDVMCLNERCDLVNYDAASKNRVGTRRMQFRPLDVDGGVSVPTVLKDLQNVLLKLDIEGREFAAFHGPLERFADLSGVVMLVVELHDIAGRNYARTVGLLSRIEKSMTLFHVHANDFGGYTDIAGHRVPNVVELTFVANRFAEGRTVSKSSFPVAGVDECNRHGGTDIPLTFLGER